jgi:hypothetical protein
MFDPSMQEALKTDLIQWISGLEDPGILGVLAHIKVAFSSEADGLLDGEDALLIPSLAPRTPRPSPEEELQQWVEDWLAEIEEQKKST